MRRSAPVLFAALALGGCAAPSTPAGGLDPHRVLPGQWGWEGSDDCGVAPLRIRFSDEGKRMHISHAPAAATGGRLARHDTDYSVLGEVPNGLSMAMDGEERLDDAGKPVTWTLRLIDEHRYCWRRGDWPDDACTQRVLRCLVQSDEAFPET